MKSKTLILIPFLVFLVKTICYSQESIEYIPFLLQSGKWTYVKKGTKIQVTNKTFIKTLPFDINGLSIAYDFETPNERYTQNSEVAYLINKKMNVIHKKISKPLPGSMQIDGDKLIERFYASDTNLIYYKVREGSTDNLLTGIINNLGIKIFEPNKYQDFSSISCSRILGQKYQRSTNQYLSGILTLEGEEVLPLSPIKFLGRFESQLVAYETSEKCGYMDVNGNEIIFPQFKYCNNFWNELAGVSQTGYSSFQTTFINKKQKEINLKGYIKSLLGTENFSINLLNKNEYTNSKFDKPTSNYIVAISTIERYSTKINEVVILDTTLKVISRIKLPSSTTNENNWEIESIYQNIIKFKKQYKALLFNFKSNKIVEDNIDYSNSSLVNVSDGLFPYKDEELGWGFKNTNGDPVIKPIYYECKPFEFGLAFVKDISGWNIINKDGKKIISLGKKYTKYNLRLVSPDLILCEEKETYCGTPSILKGCRDFYIDINGFEYKEREEELK